MSSGKSESAITYMNERPDEKFIYITPYLKEAERIKKSCPNLHFVEPSNADKELGHKKLNHAVDLIQRGRNVATTHQLLRRFDEELLEGIVNHEYTLIIDEAIDFLEEYAISEDDLDAAVQAGFVKKEGSEYSLGEREYHGGAFSGLLNILQSNSVRKKDGLRNGAVFYWTLSPKLITAFKDVYILTYLFEGQNTGLFLKMHDIPYEKVGIEKSADGRYRFAKDGDYVPEYVSHLKDMIHIHENRKMNAIGEDYHALSMNWFDTADTKTITQAKNNLNNYFRHYFEDIPASRRMWATASAGRSKLTGNGYSKGFVMWNERATNQYRDKTHLAYMMNVFMNVAKMQFYRDCGVEPDNDRYALSTLIQWIWRSAIRDGKEIWLYLPSRRMRELLTNWIDEVSQTGDVEYHDNITEEQEE